MGADLAGKHACPQSDDKMGNPFPSHSWKSTRPPATLHLQAPQSLHGRQGLGLGAAGLGVTGGQRRRRKEDSTVHQAPATLPPAVPAGTP